MVVVVVVVVIMMMIEYVDKVRDSDGYVYLQQHEQVSVPLSTLIIMKCIKQN